MTAINFAIPHIAGTPVNLSVSFGESVFVLGANGTGKSSLMQYLYTNRVGNARRISAHRQTWFSSNAITLSPQQKRDTENTILSNDTSPQSRWSDNYAAYRASIAIYDLIDAENVRARSIAEKVLREEVFQRLPGKDDVARGTPINILIDVPTVVQAEHDRLQDALNNESLEDIVARYPIRETSALGEIARKVGFQSREQYESAARKLLMDDDEALVFVKSLFGTLVADMDAA